MIISSFQELRELYDEHDIGYHIDILEGEMIGDDSDFECAVIYSDNWGYPHECYVYTEIFCYSLEHLSKIYNNQTVLFDCVIAIPRNPDVETKQ